MTDSARAATGKDLAAFSPARSRDEFQQRLRWALRLLWRGKLMILACVAAALVPTILLLQQSVPRYSAEARIMIEAPETRDVLTDRVNARPIMNEFVVQTESDLISSTLLARRVIDKLQLDKDPEFNLALRKRSALDSVLAAVNPLGWLVSAAGSKAEPEGMSRTSEADMARTAVVRRFLSGLKVTPKRRTFIINIAFTSENREKAALIANTVAELYMVDRLEAGFEEARRVSGWLGARLDSLRGDLVAAEGAVERYRSEHRLRRKGDRQGTMTEQQLSELNSRLVIARSELAQKQARMALAQSLIRSRGSVDTSSDVLQSPLIQRLREQEANSQRELSDAAKTYGERHPRIIGLKAELNEIHSKIQTEIEKVAASVANEVGVAAAGVRTLERELEATRAQSDVAGEAEVRLRELERQADASRSLYEAFLTRFKREAEQERMQRGNARLVSPAEIPTAPSYPNKPTTIMVVLLMALGFGVILVFLLDHLDNAVRSSDEAEELTELPTLAMVPALNAKNADPKSEILDHPRSALAESIRGLQMSVDMGEDGGSPITLVTSSVPKEGKTFVSLSLALQMSRVKPRVLLLDGDIHRPRLHAALGLENSRGLADVLAGDTAPDDVIRPAVAGTLDFMPAGRAVNLSELVKSPEMEALLNTLLHRYDRIVIDSPPVLAVADTRIMAKLAHRVIYLVRWNSTPRDAIRNGLKLLRSSGAALTGVVLSQVNPRKHARYGYGDYGQYYGSYNYYRSE